MAAHLVAMLKDIFFYLLMVGVEKARVFAPETFIHAGLIFARKDRAYLSQGARYLTGENLKVV